MDAESNSLNMKVDFQSLSNKDRLHLPVMVADSDNDKSNGISNNDNAIMSSSDGPKQSKRRGRWTKRQSNGASDYLPNFLDSELAAVAYTNTLSVTAAARLQSLVISPTATPIVPVAMTDGSIEVKGVKIKGLKQRPFVRACSGAGQVVLDNSVQWEVKRNERM
jgi:hypothetical protein